jgi:hypothetical protein
MNTSIAAAALLLTLQSPAAMPQDWSRVLTLRSGEEVVVTTVAGGALDAVFAGASADRMRVLALGSGEVAIAIRTLLRGSLTTDRLAAALDGHEFASGDVSLGPRGLTSRGRLIATTPTVVREFNRADITEIRGGRGGRAGRRRPPAAAGLALIVAGSGMIVFNSLGLAGDATIPPGGERDGYLGGTGIAIGSALVVGGGVILYRLAKARSHTSRVIYSNPR